MDGICKACGKYAQELTTQPDGTTVYRCYECGHMWAERLVVFDVSFALAEHKAGGSLRGESNTVSIPILATDGLCSPANGGGSM